METTTTSARPELYMSQEGQISCLPHAPFPGTDTWHWSQWHKMTLAETRDFELGVRRAPACETCLAIARNGGPR